MYKRYALRSPFLVPVVHKTKDEGKTVIVEGVYVPSPRDKYLIEHLRRSAAQGNVSAPAFQSQAKEACPLCKLGLEVKHTVSLTSG
jgi:hypothetical protein